MTVASKCADLVSGPDPERPQRNTIALEDGVVEHITAYMAISS